MREQMKPAVETAPRKCPGWVIGLNRSRGRALRRAACPCQDGTMGASYLTMRGQKHVPKTDDQHDDRAFYHRRRWERSERSETTSASRTVSNTRTDAIGDAVMIASGV